MAAGDGPWWTFGGRPVADPAALRRDGRGRGLPAGGWWGRCNSYRCPAGEEAGTAHLLLRQADFDALAAGTAADFALAVGDGTRTLGVQRLTLTRAERVLPAADADGGAVLWVQARDRRLHLSRMPTDRRFNLRDAAGSRLSSTKDGSADWTWSRACQVLWETDLGLGPFPGLPFAPDGVPEGFDFSGGMAWAALHDVLRRLACTSVYDPQADAFSLRRLGAADDAAAAVIAAHLPARVWDTRAVGLDDATDPPRGWSPEKVRVRFRRSPPPADGSSPVYLVSVPLASTGVVAGTVVTLDDDEPALGATGTPSNSAALAARAAERAADWGRRRGVGEPPRLAVYRGVRPVLCGLLGSPGATAWAVADRGAGPVTELAAEPGGEWARAAAPAAAEAARTCRTSAANDGTQWTAAKLVLPFDPHFSAGPATGADVLVQPNYGAGVTVGAVTFQHTLVSGIDYELAQEQPADTTTGKRKFYVMPVGLVKCDASVTPNVLRGI